MSFSASRATVLAWSIGLALTAPSLVTRDASAQRRRARHPAAAPPPAAPAQSSAAPAGAPAPTPPIAPVPLTQGESIGNRVARARSFQDQLEFERAIALLLPLHDLHDVPPQLGLDAALIETNAWVGLQRTNEAVEACRRAIAYANYDPDVAHEQSPRVRAVCQTAADQARQQLGVQRGIAIGTVNITTAPVAWNPIRVEVPFRGDLTGLTAQAEVTVGSAAPVVITLPPTGQPERIANIDANLAAPGAQVRVTPLVRDAFGVLVRAETPSTAMVPTAEAAVRFAVGSDEGPLRVDSHPVGANAAVGGVLPLPVGTHLLEVRTARGNESSSRVSLHRGEVALVTLQTTTVVDVGAIVKWGATVTGVLALGTGLVFQAFSISRASELESLANTRESGTGLPVVDYNPATQSVDASRTQFQDLAIGFYIGGGLLAALAAVMWATTSGSDEHADSSPPQPPRVSFGITPRSVGLSIRF